MYDYNKLARSISLLRFYTPQSPSITDSLNSDTIAAIDLSTKCFKLYADGYEMVDMTKLTNNLSHYKHMAETNKVMSFEEQCGYLEALKDIESLLKDVTKQL